MCFYTKYITNIIKIIKITAKRKTKNNSLNNNLTVKRIFITLKKSKSKKVSKKVNITQYTLYKK